MSVNGASLTRGSNGIFTGAVTGVRSGSTVQYTVNFSKASNGSINFIVNSSNNSVIQSELSAMVVGVYDGSNYLNAPAGEYINSSNFSGSGSYGFTVGNLNLNTSNSYTIAVGLIGGSFNANLYEISVNGSKLSAGSNPAILSGTIAGNRLGNTVSYNMSVVRNTPTTPSSPAPSTPSTSSANQPSVATVGSVNVSGSVPKEAKASINDNAEFTVSQKVTLKLSVDSDKSTAKMLISNDKEFRTASWETFAETKDWILTEGYGVKTVYVQYKDYYGNFSSVVTDEIKYVEKITEPVSSSVSNTVKIAAETPVSETPKTNGEILGVSNYRFISSLTLGSEGEEVRQLQLKLSDIDLFQGVATGNFGTETLKSLKNYQRSKGITPSGIVGPITRNALNKNVTVTATPQTIGLIFGARNSEVVNLQNKLKTAKLFTEKSSGYFGPATREAVKKFQTKMGLPVTGTADKETLAKLNSPETIKEIENAVIAESNARTEKIRKDIIAKKAELLNSLNLLLIRLQAENQGLR